MKEGNDLSLFSGRKNYAENIYIGKFFVGFIAYILLVHTVFNFTNLISSLEISEIWGVFMFEVFVYAVPIVVYVVLKKESLKTLFPCEPVKLKTVLLLLGLAISSSLALSTLMVAIVGILGHSSTDIPFLIQVIGDGYPFYVVFLLFGVSTAILAELLFRGIVCNELKFFNLRKSAIINGVFFASISTFLVPSVEVAIVTLVGGFLLAYAFHYTKNIFVPIALHLIHAVIAIGSAYILQELEENAVEYIMFTETATEDIIMSIITGVFFTIIFVFLARKFVRNITI